MCASLSDSHACPVCSRNYGEKSVRVRVVLGVYSCTRYIRTLYSHTYKQNQLFDLKGENNPTTSSDSRMRSGEHRGHRGSQGMLQYTRDGTSRPYTRSPVRLLPSGPCYCCDLMKCYARSPAITFPLHRLTPHSVSSLIAGHWDIFPLRQSLGLLLKTLYLVEMCADIV